MAFPCITTVGNSANQYLHKVKIQPNRPVYSVYRNTKWHIRFLKERHWMTIFCAFSPSDELLLQYSMHRCNQNNLFTSGSGKESPWLGELVPLKKWQCYEAPFSPRTVVWFQYDMIGKYSVVGKYCVASNLLEWVEETWKPRGHTFSSKNISWFIASAISFNKYIHIPEHHIWTNSSTMDKTMVTLCQKKRVPILPSTNLT